MADGKNLTEEEKKKAEEEKTQVVNENKDADGEKRMTAEEKNFKLWERYNICRDRELDNFLKRSSFVWVILAVCFPIYGKAIVNCINDNHICDVVWCSFISLIGISFSFIWIKMVNASKAWYEVYENAIWEIESLRNDFGFSPNFLIHNFWSSKDGNRKQSPSKLVLLIGYMLFVIWILSLIFDILLFFRTEMMTKISTLYQKQDGFIFFMGAFICGILVALLFILIIYRTPLFSSFCSSSTIRDAFDDYIFKRIKNDLKGKTYFYYEIKDKKVTFIFNEKNYYNYPTIVNLFSDVAVSDFKGFALSYSIDDIQKHYQTIDNIINNRARLITPSNNDNQQTDKDDTLTNIDNKQTDLSK